MNKSYLLRTDANRGETSGKPAKYILLNRRNYKKKPGKIAYHGILTSFFLSLTIIPPENTTLQPSSPPHVQILQHACYMAYQTTSLSL